MNKCKAKNNAKNLRNLKPIANKNQKNRVN